MTRWFLRQRVTGAVVVVTHEDTLKRCLADGYALLPTPELAPAPDPEPEEPPVTPDPTPAPDPEPPPAAEPTPAPKRRGRPPKAQPKVKSHAR